MGKKMKKKGFTLVELLVVIAIIAMLLAILMPALGKVRQLAQRIMCGTNVGGIGKAMLTYSSDDKYESYPIAGPANTVLDLGTTSVEPKCTWTWYKKAAPGTTDNLGTPAAQKSTLSANLYLLIKYADVSPEQFVCPGSDEKKFEMGIYSFPTSGAGTNFTEVWDFGTPSATSAQLNPGKARGRGHNSYSYQLPLPLATSGIGNTVYPITTVTNPAKAVMADRSPYWDKNASAKSYKWVTADMKINPDSIPAGNNIYHQKDGQNVLFADQHAKFEKIANCGIEMDNIYTTWGIPSSDTSFPTEPGLKAKMKQVGGPPSGEETTPLPGPPTIDKRNWPQDVEDSFLLSDYN